MGFSVADQTIAFFVSFGLGCILGFFYDIFRVIRIAKMHKAITIFFEDLFFFTVSAFATFLLMLSEVSGEIRGFILIGELLGFIIYYLTIGELIIRVSSKLINFIKKVCRFINRVFIAPILKLLRIIMRFLKKYLKKLFGILKKISIILKFNLKQTKVILYNSVKNKRKKGKSKN